MHRRLADNNGPRFAQASYLKRIIAGVEVLEHDRTTTGGHIDRFKVIFNQNRNAMQGPAHTTSPSLQIQRGSLSQGVWIDPDDGIERRTSLVQVFNTLQISQRQSVGADNALRLRSLQLFYRALSDIETRHAKFSPSLVMQQVHSMLRYLVIADDKPPNAHRRAHSARDPFLCKLLALGDSAYGNGNLKADLLGSVDRPAKSGGLLSL